MIYLKIIFEQIKGNLAVCGVAILGILAAVTMILPKDSKARKVLTWFTKR